jgi:prepilin-type N-terminal cleavage/methylation domain-containing protein
MKKRDGFTMIELLVSMAVLTVGTASLFALQGFVATSNMNSKEITVATSIAENWVERLKMDALNWTLAGDVGAPGIHLGNTAYLKDIDNAQNAWRAPLLTNNSVLGHSPGYDMNGAEIKSWPPADNVLVAYCTNFRFTWINPGSLMRVDVRVFWPIRPSAASIKTDFPQCNNSSGVLTHYRAVYTSTMIRWTPSSI